MKLLVFQSAYNYETLLQRNLIDFATSKDLGGFFKKVYTVHAAATVEIDVNSRERYGRFSTIEHSDTHTFIEAKVGRYWQLRKFALLNFALSQIGLMIHLVRMAWGDNDLLIRAEDPRYNGLLGYFLTRIKRLPFIVGTWGNPDSIRRFTHEPLQPRVFRTAKAEERCERFLMRHADCVLVQNEDNFKYAVSYGAKEENVKYFRLGNAIYPKHFDEPSIRTLSAEDLKAIEGNDFKICTVSRLEKLKIVDHTLRAFHFMRRKSECQLYIFGDGSERDSLMKLAVDLGINGRTHFLGNVDQARLAGFLSRMNLVLSPSMGRALTEAALAALPIVAYDVDCHPEIVRTGETGILVAYLDTKAMAEAADYLFENPIEAGKMGNEARNETMKLMDPERLIQEQRLVFSAFAPSAS